MLTVSNTGDHKVSMGDCGQPASKRKGSATHIYADVHVFLTCDPMAVDQKSSEVDSKNLDSWQAHSLCKLGPTNSLHPVHPPRYLTSSILVGFCRPFQKFWPVSLSRKGKLLALESGGKTTSIPVDRYR